MTAIVMAFREGGVETADILIYSSIYTQRVWWLGMKGEGGDIQREVLVQCLHLCIKRSLHSPRNHCQNYAAHLAWKQFGIKCCQVSLYIHRCLSRLLLVTSMATWRSISHLKKWKGFWWTSLWYYCEPAAQTSSKVITVYKWLPVMMSVGSVRESTAR